MEYINLFWLLCVLCTLELMQCSVTMDMDPLSVDVSITTAQHSDNQRRNIHGNLFTVSDEGNMFVSTLSTGDLELTTVQQYTLTYNGSNIVSLAPQGRSLTDSSLVHAVLDDSAYIASNTSVLVVSLNTSNAPFLTYEMLEVGHTPSAVNAFTLEGGDPFVVVSYVTENDREYVARFRKYQNEVWGYYGEPVLIVTPNWYNLSIISNTLVYKGAERFSTTFQTVLSAVAEQWYIFTRDLIDGSTRTFLAPEPCDNIQRLVYSEHSQRMLIQCAEATVLFNAKEKEFNSLWSDVIGTAYIDPNGDYGAVVNSSGDGITVLRLHGDYHSTSLSVEGAIHNAVFVDAGENLHYLCYVGQFGEEYAVKCVHIEQLNSTQNPTLLYRGTAEAPPTLYTSNNLLSVQHSAANNCPPMVQIFDMISLINTHNITNISPALIAFKPLPLPPAVNTTDIPTTTTPHTPHTLHTTHTPTSTTTADNLAQCTMELQDLQYDYRQLLLATVITCSLFCVILLATVVVLAILLYQVRAHAVKLNPNEPPVLTDVKKS